jgi:hypothetical protein
MVGLNGYMVEKEMTGLENRIACEEVVSPRTGRDGFVWWIGEDDERPISSDRPDGLSMVRIPPSVNWDENVARPWSNITWCES